MKTCTKCSEAKPFDQFAKDKQKSDGYRSSCKACNTSYRAAYYQEHKDEAIRYSRDWYRKNKDRAVGVMREWVENNKEKANTNWRNRRARKRDAAGSHTAEDVKRLWEMQKGKCGCCQADLEKAGSHVDHVVPLAGGGSNGVENLQILCPSCNLKKGAKHPIDFMQANGFLL